MQRVVFCFGVLCAVALLGPLSVDLAQSPSVPALTVDAAANRHPVNPNIYGIASFGLDPVFAKEIQVPNVRWGGDTTTRYNWLVDSSNAGFDWFFLGGSGQSNPVPSASVDQMISTYRMAGARALITIPIIPFVNRSAASTCSFPVSTYGPQQKIDPSDHPGGEQCGNSLSILGDQIVDVDVYANHIDNSVSLQQGWLQHLISTFGTAANGGVSYYQLDNEPSYWSYTHRDVMPAGADYPTITSLGQSYAAMIKDTDPSAKVFGPTDYSGQAWIGDPALQNGLYAGQYYLQQMASYDQRHGQRILDYFDEHYYATSTDDASELASTRTLWDPTYTSSGASIFNAPMRLIPRFKGWIQQYYPGTKLSISEYGFSRGRNPLVDGITQADVLGIFGREGLDFANLWTLGASPTAPLPPAPVLAVFQIFRNYDGQGGQYGDVSVESDSSNQNALSIYGAQRSSDQALTVLVINKTTHPIATDLSLANFSAGSASVFSYSSVDLAHVLPAGEVGVTANQIDYTYPAYSATLFVIPDSAPAPATVTLLSASATSLTVSQPVTFTAEVSVLSSSNPPAGSVTFVNGQTALGTVSLANDAASFTTSALSSGAHTITAAYSGQVNDAASVSAPLIVTVSPSPDYSLALSSSALRVSRGDPLQLTVTVASQNGFTAPVSFACAGLPAGASCAFNPSTLSPNGGSASTTLTVSAPASSTLRTYPSDPSKRRLFPIVLLAFALLVFAAGRVFRRVRWLRAFVLASCCVCLAGCAFKSPSRNIQSATAGSVTYVVSVVATAPNAPSHSQQFTLTLLQ
ncbi:MAG TPA: glycoside hydrolase family 44 protein [Candidatus Acidoferrales bacterium]|nr:glycoside hydrolase family 44 protein [Candidatus Acidoferrales bacterium]